MNIFRNIETLKLTSSSRQICNVLILVLLVVFMGCKKENKKTLPATDTKEQIPPEASKKTLQTDGTATENLRRRRVHVNKASTNGTTGGNSNIFKELNDRKKKRSTDISALYDRLEMSPSQINSYEDAMLDYQKNLGGGSNQKPTKTLTDEMEVQLKKILSKKQFKRYKELY